MSSLLLASGTSDTFTTTLTDTTETIVPVYAFLPMGSFRDAGYVECTLSGVNTAATAAQTLTLNAYVGVVPGTGTSIFASNPPNFAITPSTTDIWELIARFRVSQTASTGTRLNAAGTFLYSAVQTNGAASNTSSQAFLEGGGSQVISTLLVADAYLWVTLKMSVTAAAFGVKSAVYRLVGGRPAGMFAGVI